MRDVWARRTSSGRPGDKETRDLAGPAGIDSRSGEATRQYRSNETNMACPGKYGGGSPGVFTMGFVGLEGWRLGSVFFP